MRSRHLRCWKVWARDSRSKGSIWRRSASRAARDLGAVIERFQEAGIEFVHPMREQPWGQCVVRVYDPDRHTVEVSEPIPVFVARFLNQGMSAEQAAERTSIPPEVVQQIVQSVDE